MNDLKITIVQSNIIWENIEQNLINYSNILNGISNTDIIILPETFATGFTNNVDSFNENSNGKILNWLKEKAKHLNSVIIGSAFIKDNNKIYNRLIFMYPDGNYSYYNKSHLFRMTDENKYISKGDSKIIVDYKGWKICPLICYDLRFPIWSRNKVVDNSFDYDVLVYIANWPERRSSIWETLLKARAIENQCYTIGVNRIGNDGNNISHSGNSLVSDFFGAVLSNIEPHKQTIETIVLSKEKLAEFRRSFPAHLDADNFEILK